MTALRITGLDELVGKEPVKAHPVIVVAPDKLLEIGHGLGSGIFPQLDNDALRLLFFANLHEHYG
jgi:hypothetical protein